MARLVRKLFWILFLLLFIGALVGAGLVTWGYYYITRDLPDSSQLANYRFKAASFVYAADGTFLDEFYDERRYPISIQDIPLIVRNAFLAAEDASFYQHAGIDLVSIFRAFVKNLESGSARQGGSTITQQVVKNLLLNREKTLSRKAKEAILSYRIEKNLSKDQILELYLNQIYLGNTAYGVKAAAKCYFRKELAELSVAEAAMLAGLPAAPSEYSPVSHPEKARVRQRYVLGQMLSENMITKEAYEEAIHQEIAVYPAATRTFQKAPYYVDDVERAFADEWKEFNIQTDGLQIYTAADLGAEAMATSALRRGLKELDKRRGWRGPLKAYTRETIKNFITEFPKAYRQPFQGTEIYPAVVTSVSPSNVVRVQIGSQPGVLDLKEAAWAKKRLDAQDNVTWGEPAQLLKPGSVIEIGFAPQKDGQEPSPVVKDGVVTNLTLEQTPEVEGALVLLDPHSGKVLTMIGGYDYQRSKFNRVSQALRQPGSSFKPILYLTAVDKFHYTPSTIVYDTPRTFRVGDEFWVPGNFDGKYLGPITLRTALEKSRNLVSADIISKIGVDPVITYARQMGIQSPLGRNLSLALGSSEVNLLEMARAYGVFPARGVLFPTTLITKIVDQKGKVLFDFEQERLSRAKQVINENSAFIMSWMMKGVVERGTAMRLRALNRPLAGKTGTSNDLMDAWFIGYTPEWVCGVWVGFDLKKKIGEKETGGAVSAPVFQYFMQDFLKKVDERRRAQQIESAKAESARLGIEYQDPPPLEPLDFQVPQGTDPFWVDHDSGLLSKADTPGAILEYFVKGTEPGRGGQDSASAESYLQSTDF